MKELDNKEILACCGIKNTKQRHLILDCLKSVDKAMTAEEIYFNTNEIDKTMSLSTVYRTLEMLLEKEIVIKTLATEQSKAHYIINEHTHQHHMICIGCKAMTPIEGCPITQFEETLAQQTNFKVMGHHLEVYGYCQACQKQKELINQSQIDHKKRPD